ncbi:MAG: hypothetical protein IIB57_02675 [Planctomycetes bacterium]|nr:hypothetical protein [Planctomycetota bacterium]
MTRRTSPRRLWCGASALLVAALMTGLLFAQPNPSTTPAAKKPLPDPRKGIRNAKLDRVGAKSARAAKRGRKPMVMDKNAKWVCENATITLEPIWRSSKAIECSFDIRNDGTAPLHIKARGG